MNVSCPDCRSVFRIDPAKVPDAGVRARCAVCGAVFDLARTPVVQPSTPRATTLSAPVAIVAPAAAASFDAPSTSVVVSQEQLTSATTATGEAVPAMAELAVSASSEAPPREEPGIAMATGVSVPEPNGVPAAPAAEAQTAAEPRIRPVNPYLNNTPELRARRLARALVSDLVAYNPQKREQGLRDGTLRQLFRDEIRKSWDEYVEQVGAAVAESTPHFQDALNDVLAGGRRVF